MIKKITLLLFITSLSAISYHAISNASGPPTGRTGAPGESTCLSSGCHSGSPITSGSNWDNLTLTSTFGTGNGYLPDSNYVIKLSHSVSGVSKWGFQVTVFDSANNPIGALTTISSASREQRQASGSKEYIYHTSTGTSSTSSNTSVWTFNWKAPKTNSGPIKFYAAVMAANGNSSADADPVYLKTFRIKPSSVIPVADAKCKDSVTCAGNTITLEGSSTQTTSTMNWYWTLPGATLVAPSTVRSQNPVVRYNNPGTFWAILISENNKAKSMKSDSVKIVVRTKPTLSTTPNAGSYTFCKGDSLLLKAVGSASNSYTWSNGNLSQNIYVKDTGRYTVTTKDANGCTNTSGIIRVIHHAENTMSLARNVSNDTICFERPIVVTASGSTAFDSILYFTSSGKFQTTAINPQTFKFSTSTDLYAFGKDKNKCLTPKSNKLNFVVKKGVEAPKPTCASKTSSSFEINWASVTNALGYKVSVDSGKTWINPSSGANGFSHQVLGFPANTDIEVQVKALDVSPCNESEISKVVCGSIPCSPISYDVVWDKDACKGSLINFSIRNLNTTKFSLKINSAGPFKDTLFKITADFSRTYIFELTDSGNLSCPTIKRNAAVTVWEIPNLTLTSNNSQNIFCEGQAATFDVISKGMEEYNFFVNNMSKQKSNAATWKYANPANLDSVWVTVKNGACMSTSEKIKLGVSPLPSAKFNYAVASGSIKFTPLQTGTNKFYWDFGDGTKDTVNSSPIHNYGALKKALVTLKVVNEFGCENTDTMTIRISGGIKNALTDFGIKLYPQPVKNSLSIEIPAGFIDSDIKLLDMQGRVVYSGLLLKRKSELYLSEYADGIYTLSIEKDKIMYYGKVTIRH